jgi:agmatine/peptidylarginine deiminase
VHAVGALLSFIAAFRTESSCSFVLNTPTDKHHTLLSCLQPKHISKGYVPRLANARLPGSYINHYCANGGVVAPQFGYHTGETLTFESTLNSYLAGPVPIMGS